jgi:hypothetical protein
MNVAEASVAARFSVGRTRRAWVVTAFLLGLWMAAASSGAEGAIETQRFRLVLNGADDLRAFSELVRSKGMRLNLHYVSGGIGLADPTYVGSKPDRRLAGWVQGTLANAGRSDHDGRRSGAGSGAVSRVPASAIPWRLCR